MKKSKILLVLFVLLLASCKSTKSDDAAKAQEIQLQKIDSVTNVMDNAKTDIDSSIAEVDELINEI